MEIEVIVQSILPSDGPQGRYRIKITEDSTVANLLQKTCAEAHVPLKQSYCLRHAANELLNREATLKLCNIRNGEVVHWTDEATAETKKVKLNTWWFLCLLSLIIGIVGLVAISVVKAKSDQHDFEYGIVMDAGSSHTNMYVYKWDGEKYKQTAIASQFGETCKVTGKGISTFLNNLDEISKGLKRCLEKAKNIIPDDHWKKSPVYLGATAGMRLLQEVNSTQSDSILSEVRQTIGQYPFLFDKPEIQARILTGDEEGLFSWITSNYVSKSFKVNPPKPSTLQAKKSPTIGALDLGGASAQISFIPANYTTQPVNYTQSIQLYSVNYTLYTHSYLCYGVNEAQRRLQAALTVDQNFSRTVKDPCAPVGHVVNVSYEKVFKAPCTSGMDKQQDYSFLLDDPVPIFTPNETLEFVGESYPDQCLSFIQDNLFDFNQTCSYPHCSFNGQYQPDVFGEFYAFSSFYYVAHFLNLTNGTEQFTLDQLNTSTLQLCNKTWDEVKIMPAVLPSSLSWYCFQANYIITMLTRGYGFNEDNWNTLRFIKQVEHTDIGWSLGFMLNESNQLPVNEPVKPIGLTTFILLIILFSLFILVSIGFACHARKHSKAKRKGYSLFSNYGAV